MFETAKIELKNLAKDRFLIFMYFLMPLIVGFFVFYTLNDSIIRHLPIGVLNLDKSAESRQIMHNINAHPTLEITHNFSSLSEAKSAMSKKEIYAIVVLPKDLESNAKLGITTKIPIYYNAELVFVGKNIQSAMTQILANENVKLKFAKNIANTHNTTLAMGQSVEVLPQIIALYNPNSDFLAFILPAMIPCLWQLFIILCMISIIAHDERDVGRIKNKTSDIKNFYAHLGVKFALNTIIFLAWWGVFMAVFLHFGIMENIAPIHLSTLAVCAFITILAYNAIGIFIYALIHSHTRAISIAAVYAAPSLAFVGITYPINNMEFFANFWSKILPITRYLEVYMQQANYAIMPSISLHAISYNFIFLLFGILGLLIYRKKVALQ